MDSRAVIKAIQADGWRLKSMRGSHHQFDHPTKAGKVTVTHPRKEIPIGTLKKIEQQAGLQLRRS